MPEHDTERQDSVLTREQIEQIRFRNDIDDPGRQEVRAVCDTAIALTQTCGEQRERAERAERERSQAESDRQREHDLRVTMAGNLEQAERERDEAKREGMEAAAKICDEMPCECCWHEDAKTMADTCATAIRAAMQAPGTKEETR